MAAKPGKRRVREASALPPDAGEVVFALRALLDSSIDNLERDEPGLRMSLMTFCNVNLRRLDRMVDHLGRLIRLRARSLEKEG
jgi:hypothetical protein